MGTRRILLAAVFTTTTSWSVFAQDAARLVEVLAETPPEGAAEANGRAAGSDSGDAEATAGDSVSPLFFLRDRSKVAGEPRFETILVRTKYGVLTIPSSELVNVRFVARLDPQVKEKVRDIVAKLGDEDFDVREKAMDSARQVGPDALPMLREALKSGNEEVANRAQILVEELEAVQEKQGEGVGESVDRVRGTEDEIVTTRMTIRGMVELERVEIASRYGQLAIDIADLLAISFRKVAEDSRKVEVQPRFQPPGSWLDSKLDIANGQRFQIEADGTISVSNYGVSSGPTGTNQWSGNTFNNFPMLSLVGKVGKKGKPFLIGQKYRGKVKAGGRLYLSIVPFVYNPGGATGKYDARIKLQGGD